MVIIALFLIYAASLEIAQHYAPGRHASVLDWMAKSFGALIGVIIGASTVRWRPPDERKVEADFLRP
jgi:VanZ family protein